MFNKKILTAAVAALLAPTAFASVDLNAGTGVKTLATDSIAYAAQLAAAPVGEIQINANTVLTNITADVGFAIAANTTRYVRIDMTNATFTANVVIADLTFAGDVTGPNVSKVVSTGGTIGESFVVFEINDADDEYAAASNFTFLPGEIQLDTVGQAVTHQYRLYADPVEASQGTSATLASTGPVTTIGFGAAKVAEFVSAETATATGESEFKEFAVVAPTPEGFASATDARLGTLVPSDALDTDLSDIDDGNAVALTDLYDGDQLLSIAGDFSFGTWTLETTQSCGGVSTPLDTTDPTVATLANYDFTAGTTQYLCVNVDGTETIPDQSANLALTLADDGLTEEFGQTDYDTATVTIPYLTVFDGYNQRIYLQNNGSVAASYTTTFKAEGAVVPTPGDAATGTIAAGELKMIQASDLVSFSSGNRGSAVINIQAPASSIVATTQIVSRSNETFGQRGQTDTVILTVE